MRANDETLQNKISTRNKIHIKIWSEMYTLG